MQYDSPQQELPAEMESLRLPDTMPDGVTYAYAGTRRYAGMKFSYKSKGAGFSRADKMRNHIWRDHFFLNLHIALRHKPF